MLFLMGMMAGTFLMILAQRRAGAIRLRIEQRCEGRQPAASQDCAALASTRARDGAAPAGENAVAGTAATVGVTFPEDLCIQVGVR